MLRLYTKYLDMNLRAQLEHRQSFVMMLLSQALLAFSSFLVLQILMQRFGSVGGFGLDEVMLSFAVTWMSFSLAETFVRGFDRFSVLIANGGFDRVLLRPRSAILQVLGSTVDFSRLGRLLQALIILILIAVRGPIQWDFLRLLTLSNMLVGGFCVFAGLFILQAGVTFFTTEGLEIFNIFTDGGREFGSYPMLIYGQLMLRFFTFVVPIALFQTYPLAYLFGRSQNLGLVFLPLLAGLFLLPAYLLWRLGRRRYESTGS